MDPVIVLGAILFTLFLWWFTTGVIIAVYGRSAPLRAFCFAGLTIAMLAAIALLRATSGWQTTTAVYLSLTSGIVIWGWHTASYYLGFITGSPQGLDLTPETHAQLTSIDRFKTALSASLYHELSVLAFAVGLALLLWKQPNQWGLWIFLAMWVMHSSAKLNVFLGVRNFRIDLLPSHLHHLQPLLGKESINGFFPFSMLIACCVTLFFLFQAMMPYTIPAHSIGYLSVGTMIALGMLEHFMLILPTSVVLWGWGWRPLTETAVD